LSLPEFAKNHKLSKAISHCLLRLPATIIIVITNFSYDSNVKKIFFNRKHFTLKQTNL